MNRVLEVPVCLPECEMKDECIAQIPPGSYSGFNIHIFEQNINMKRADFSCVIQRGTFNIPQAISYLQASFVSVFAERREDAEEERTCFHNSLKRLGTNL